MAQIIRGKKTKHMLFLFQVISHLDTLVNLEVLDLSYNRIRKIEGLSALCNLKRIYLVHNKIEKIDGLEALTKLEVLELGDNRIKVALCSSLSNIFIWSLVIIMTSIIIFFSEIRKHWTLAKSSGTVCW